VQAKIRNQAANLDEDSPARRKLLRLARQVRSGDTGNAEAQAARIYWQHWLGPEEPFRRDPDVTGLNSFLNYGYAVMRAAVGRAIVAAGLTPAVGLFHCSRGNAFCLADDLVEPLRPLVDERVKMLKELGHVDLTQEAKAGLLDLLAAPMRTAGQEGPLMGRLHLLVASLVRCFGGSANRLDIPQRCEPGVRAAAD